MVKAVIFDMDGVIVDNHHYHLIAWEQFCAQMGIAFSEKDFRIKYFGKSNRDILSGLNGKPITASLAHELGEQKESIYRELYEPYIQPVKGLVFLLGELKANGYKLAVATSAGKANLQFVMQKLNLSQYFDLLVDATFVTNAKPHPEIYLKAAELLAIPPNQCVVFEDSVSGINAAKGAGMDVIGLLTTHRQTELPSCKFFIMDFLSREILEYFNLL
jgi:beta-phosphoglucomutase family hydrolase